MSKFICFLFVVLLFQSVDAQQPQQQNQRQQNTITVEQIMEQLPEGVTIIPDIAYREGNDAWKLDLAMPEERGNEQPARPPRKNEIRLESEEVRAKVSPVTYATADAPPILLVHAISDRTVGVSHSDQFVKALREAGAKNVSYIFWATTVGMVLFSAISRLPSLPVKLFLTAY